MKKRWYVPIMISWMLALSLLSYAQSTSDSIQLHIRWVDTPSAIVVKQAPYGKYATPGAITQILARWQQQMVLQGYAAASIDTLIQTPQQITAYLYVGKQYWWRSLQLDAGLLKLLGNNASAITYGWQRKPFTQVQLQYWLQQVQQQLLAKGYPFAATYCSNVLVQNDSIDATLSCNLGNKYIFDTIIVHGNVKLQPHVLSHTLQIFPKAVYNELLLQTINERLASLPYLQQVQPWQIDMLNSGARLHVYLAPRKSNQANVLVGILPGNVQNNNKLLLTGEANVLLQNALAVGETIQLQWQQLQPQSPRLQLGYQQPSMFKSKYSGAFNFQLFKRDSSFLNLQAGFQIGLNIAANTQLQVGIGIANSAVLQVDTQQVKLTRQLPDIADVQTLQLSLQYRQQQLNHSVNPTRGRILNWVLRAGNKTIQPNNTITALKANDFNYARLYDTVQLKTYVLQLQGQYQHFIPIKKQGTLRLAAQVGAMFSGNYFRNELFMVGGLRTLRGFDEESIYTHRYVFGTAEYRLLISAEGYIFGFTEGGVAGYPTNSGDQYRSFWSGGVGLALPTAAGVLQLTYALGTRSDVPFAVRQGKIHIGLVSRL